ncbi:MAG: T9SS type A sorting domain-containing protein [Flavobacteriales bacterium]|nr:T9SS type A sorting domain-containing protein [Flavobacteriales bacterium]MBK7942536.1 T9SS type A sorting domain-containing protein [Flavobacteriales bacterium]
MNQNFKNLLLGTALCCGSLAAQAQGLEGIIVEEFHTVTQADADVINNDLGNSSFTIAPGSKVYRVFVDMAPGYKLNQVFGAPETSPGSGVSLNPLDLSTTTTFWNDDNFGADIPGQTRRIDEGTAFDSYITVNTTGTAGGTAGCGSATQQFGVLRTADTNGDLTTCGVYPGFTGNDGSIPGTGPALTYNISGLLDLTALTGAAASFQVINDAWTTLPASQGVDPSGTNRVLIGQFTTAGTFSFHINVQLSDPNSQLETYVWNQAGSGEQVSPFLTYPQQLPPDCLGVPGGSALPGTACNDGNANTGNDTWDANCVCVGQLIDCLGVPGGPALPGTACNDGNANTGNDTWDANCTCVGQLIDCLGVPGGSALPGTACNDGNANTGNDTWDANCVCVGQLIDCLGIPGGSALPGTACNDGNANTGNDTWDANCTCVGQLIDCLGVPGGSALPGTACDDGNANTGNDTWDANCTCVGQLIDCLGVPGGSALPGTACNDGNANTGNDTWSANCTCVGQLIDCLGVPGGSALPGTACNDGNANTGNDTWSANCTCVGQLIDCLGVPGGSALPGTACDDGNPNSSNDVYDANCNCSGTLANDCLGVPGGPAQPGTACDDGLATTGNDLWDANCVCVGQLIDCLGVPGGSALPGTACNDGNANTGNDTWSANCTCVGQLIDCLGVPGGSALPGTACDDGNPNSSNDVYDANCNCSGTLANDCLGVPGGPAQPGTACDDGLATTGNDLWDANCVCVGQLIDCLGVPGGSALPGTACDDGNPNSSNDVYDANCNCSGTLANDCLGVPGGSALPGTPCDDGQVQTGNDTWDANCNCIGQLIDCLGVPGGSALPGTACNDGNAATINDVYGANCVCAGTPIGNCTEILSLDITLDNNGAETTWEVRDQSGTTVIASGGPYQNGQAGVIVTETICLNQLCYRLVVNDAGGDGISGGGFVLTDASGHRIVDANGSFTSTSSVANEFCLPLSAARLINASCDRTNLTYSSSTQIYASFYPGASGYQFWIFDPHGSYSRRVFKTTQNLVPANLVTNPVPADLDLNVRVRALVSGNYTAFGPACRFRLNTPGGGGREAILFDEASNVTMSLYPNPNRGEVVNVAFDGIAAAERMDIDVMDIFGKRVSASQIAAPGGAFVHTMDLSSLAPGVYMVNVRVGERLYTQRLVRQ